MLQFAYTLKRKFAKERGSKMATNKQEVMQQMEDCLKNIKELNSLLYLMRRFTSVLVLMYSDLDSQSLLYWGTATAAEDL